MSTKISWTDEAWNCVRGCDQVSPGCANCYAKRMAARIVRMGRGKPTPYDGLVRLTARGEPAWTGEVAFDPEKLAAPLRWKKPRRIFVNSMSDLFHENLTNEQIAAVFGVMAACPQHTFQCLTKRAKRMREWFAWADDDTARSDWMRDARRPNAAPAIHKVMEHLARTMPPSFAFQQNVSNAWPLPNVWIGVSVERQDEDHRVVDLLQTPAAVRFLSCEPLLGPLNLTNVAPDSVFCCDALAGKSFYPIPSEWKKVDWLIAGCESGPGARPGDVEWLRSLRDQCAAAEVPFFLKQARDERSAQINGVDAGGNTIGITCGTGSKRKPGGVIELPYLDGKQHAEFPR